MQTNLKFSIITVTKNNKAGLLRAIECVRNQTFKNVEHIVVDGDSADGTIQMMDDGKWLMDDVKFVSEPDYGIYDALNKGIKMASGDIICLLHSDDLYADENVLAKYAEVFKRPFDFAQVDRVDAVYSDLVYVRKKQEVRSEKLEAGNSETTDYLLPTTYSTIRYWKTQDKDFTAETQRHRALQNGWMPPHPTLFIRKEIFEKFGLYDTSLKISSDYDMILRLLFKQGITSYYLPLTTYLMSIGGTSNKSIGNIITKSREDYIAMKKNGMPFPFFTLVCKNFRKLPQFLARDLSG